MTKTIIAPIQVILAPGTASEFVINRENQLNDATFTLNDMFADHMTQESAAPIDKSFTGLETSLEISVADFEFEFFSRATNPSNRVIDAVDPTRRKLEYADLTGLRIPKQRVLFKLYDGTLPSSNTDDWTWFLSAGIETTIGATFGKESQSEYTIKFTAFPDPVTRVKVVKGDIDAQA